MGILWFNLCLGLKHPEGPQSKDTTCIGKSKHTRPQIMGIVETLHMFFFQIGLNFGVCFAAFGVDQHQVQ